MNKKMSKTIKFLLCLMVMEIIVQTTLACVSKGPGDMDTVLKSECSINYKL